MRAPSHPHAPATTRAPVVLVASFHTRNSAAQTARDYFAEYENDVLTAEQNDIARLMRGNRATFLS